MSSFPQLPVADCPQLPVAERTSEEEMQLIFEVESLQMQLSKAGLPVNARLEEIFIQSVTPNTPLTERIRKWNARRDHLRQMVANAAHPTQPPVQPTPPPLQPHHLREMPVVASDRNDSETPPEAAINDQRPGAGLHKRRQGKEHPPKKRRNVRPCFRYEERDDGNPPQMSLLHVNFAQLCVRLLERRPDLTQNDLIAPL